MAGRGNLGSNQSFPQEDFHSSKYPENRYLLAPTGDLG